MVPRLGNLDECTRRYFDTYAPEYPVDWFDFLVSFVARTASPGDSLIDVGCGSGNVLAHFRERAGVRHCVGVDISTTQLQRARDQFGLRVLRASALDRELPRIAGDHHRYVLLGHLLHHLVGPTRNASKANARRGMRNCFRLVRPGGFLLILETAYAPALSCDALFWVKRLVTAVVPGRVDLFKRFHNIGIPVVSFLTSRELDRMVIQIPDSRVAVAHKERHTVTWPMRLGLIGSTCRCSYAIQKL